MDLQEAFLAQTSWPRSLSYASVYLFWGLLAVFDNFLICYFDILQKQLWFFFHATQLKCVFWNISQTLRRQPRDFYRYIVDKLEAKPCDYLSKGWPIFSCIWFSCFLFSFFVLFCFLFFLFFFCRLWREVLLCQNPLFIDNWWNAVRVWWCYSLDYIQPSDLRHCDRSAVTNSARFQQH